MASAGHRGRRAPGLLWSPVPRIGAAPLLLGGSSWLKKMLGALGKHQALGGFLRLSGSSGRGTALHMQELPISILRELPQ